MICFFNTSWGCRRRWSCSERVLEQTGIPYTGSDAQISRLFSDKIATKLALQKINVPTPHYWICSKEDWMQTNWEDRLPFVVKPPAQGSSIGVSLVREASEIQGAFSEAFRYDKVVLVEKMISGRELTIGVLDQEILPLIEIKTEQPFFDFSAKYQTGATQYVVPADIDEATQLEFINS